MTPSLLDYNPVVQAPADREVPCPLCGARLTLMVPLAEFASYQIHSIKLPCCSATVLARQFPKEVAHQRWVVDRMHQGGLMAFDTRGIEHAMRPPSIAGATVPSEIPTYLPMRGTGQTSRVMRDDVNPLLAGPLFTYDIPRADFWRLKDPALHLPDYQPEYDHEEPLMAKPDQQPTDQPEIKMQAERPLADRFGYHPPGPGVARTHEVLREKTIEYAAHLDAILPASREKALAMTALEEVLMRANQCVAFHQTVPPAAYLDYEGPIDQQPMEMSEHPVKRPAVPHPDSQRAGFHADGKRI